LRPTLSNALQPDAGDYAALLVAQLAIGSAAILARYGLQSGLSPASLSAWRLTVASAALAAGISFAGRRRATRFSRLSRPIEARLAIAGIFLGAHFVLWFASLERISVARSTLLVTSGPLWTALGGWVLLRQRLVARFWAGLVVAGVGAYLVTGTAASGASVAGDVLAIAGAMAVAAYLLIAHSLHAAVGTSRMVAWTYSCAALAVWPWAVLSTGSAASLVPHGAMGWGAVIGMALVPQLVGHTLLNWSLKKFSAGLVAAATLLEPVFAAALARVLFGEAVTMLQGAGAVTLLLGVGVAISKPGNEERIRVS
jgi:drug/metabolite transporter (DMT)-like permease